MNDRWVWRYLLSAVIWIVLFVGGLYAVARFVYWIQL
jgi:hypothetical protein